MNNPFFRATRLAYAALTTREAKRWYLETAIQSYLVIATLITLAICLVEDWLLDSQELPAKVPPLDLPCLPPVPIAGLLPPAKTAKPIRLPGSLADSGRLLVAPPPLIYNFRLTELMGVTIPPVGVTWAELMGGTGRDQNPCGSKLGVTGGTFQGRFPYLDQKYFFGLSFLNFPGERAKF